MPLYLAKKCDEWYNECNENAHIKEETKMDGGFVLLFILAFGVLLGLNGLLAGNASDIAQEKGYEKKKWFHMCFWLGIFSYLMICAMPDKNRR